MTGLSSRARIPVHIVAGAPGSGKTALILRLLRGRADWLGLVNSAPADAPGNLRLLSAGCPCCSGRVALQVGLARGLRASGATRALVELPDSAHALLLTRLLGELPLSLSVVAARALALPRDGGLCCADLEC